MNIDWSYETISHRISHISVRRVFIVNPANEALTLLVPKVG